MAIQKSEEELTADEQMLPLTLKLSACASQFDRSLL